MGVYRRVMEVNYFGVVLVTKAVLDHMVARQCGTILNVSSVAGRIAARTTSAYAASKHALQAFTDSLRAEMASHNINVSIISPSYMQTDISYNLLLGDGRQYGENSKLITSGMTASFAARKVLECIVYRRNEMVIGPVLHRAVPYCRCLLPNLTFKYLQLAKNRSDIPS